MSSADPDHRSAVFNNNTPDAIELVVPLILWPEATAIALIQTRNHTYNLTIRAKEPLPDTMDVTY